MKYTKGMSGNPKGKPKGTKSKSVEEIRIRIKTFIDNNWQQVEDDFMKMDPKERLTIFEKLLKYAIPPLQSMNIQAEIKTTLEGMTDDQLNELAEKIITLNSGNHE